MRITNKQLSVLVEGLTQLAVDAKSNQRRDLPFVSGVRLRRSLGHLNELFEPVKESLISAQKDLNEHREHLLTQVRNEATEYSEYDFENDFNMQVDTINESIDELMQDEVTVDTSNLVTLTQLEEIGDSISEGVSQSAIDAYLTLEEILKSDLDEHSDNTKANNGS